MEATNSKLKATLNLQRKAALTGGGAIDHAGRVEVVAMENFDISETIFGALSGLPKMFMEEKLAKDARSGVRTRHWRSTRHTTSSRMVHQHLWSIRRSSTSW